MGQVRKIGDEFYIEFYARGLLYQKKAGIDHAFAVRMLEDVENKIAHGEMGTIVRDVDIDVFFETFLEYAKDVHTSITLERFQKTINHFEGFLKKKYSQLTTLSSVTPAVMEKYRVYLMQEASECSPTIKPHVLNFTLVLLESVLDHALKLGYLNDHPVLHLAWVPEIKRTPLRYIKEDKLVQIIKGRNEEESLSIQLMLLTGLKLSALGKLSWDDIDFEHNQIKIVDDPYKAGKIKTRLVPMHSVVREIFSQLKREDQDLLSFFNKHENLSKEFPAAVVQNTFAYFALKRKLRLTELYQMMGYDDVLKVMRYFELLPSKL